LQRGQHNIEDELVFPSHPGYVFHDSRGFEAGGEDEVKAVQDFVRRKSQEKRLKHRLHAIWFVLFWYLQLQSSQGLLLRYCIPMDNDRPALDLRDFNRVCPDKNGMSKRNFVNRD
jgi:hypothetical protein